MRVKVKRKMLKKNAKQQLGGCIFRTKWTNGGLVIFLTNILSICCAFIPGFGIIAAGPLLYGMSKYFLSVVYGEDKNSVKYAFDGFKDDFAGNFLLYIMRSLFIFLWSLLFCIPGIIKKYQYAVSFYVKADHPEYTWNECLKTSKKLMKGNKMKLFFLKLSFIGWFIICTWTFGVGFFWFNSYKECTYANFYAFLAAKHEPQPVAETIPSAEVPVAEAAEANAAEEAPVPEE